MNRRIRTPLLAAALATPFTTAAGLSHAQVTFEIIAEEGQPAIGLPAGTTLDSFPVDGHRLSNTGELGFAATVRPPSGSTHTAYFVRDAAGTTRVVFEQNAPLATNPADTADTLNNNAIRLLNGGGVFGLGSSRDASNTVLSTIFRAEPNAAVGTYLRKDEQAAGFPTGVLFGTTSFPFRDPRASRDGAFVVPARVEDPSVPGSRADTLFFSQNGAPAAPIYRSGDQAPGFLPGVTHAAGQIADGSIDLSENGTVAFTTLIRSTAGSSLGTAVFRHDPGVGTALVVANGTAFTNPGNPHINDSGRVLFTARINADTTVLTASSSGDIDAIARENEPVPGLDPNIVYDNFAETFSFDLNNQGVAVFQANVRNTSTNDTFEANIAVTTTTTPAAITAFAVEGQPAPGMPAGTTFDDLSPNLLLNQAGDIVFLAELTGPAITTANDRALYIARPNGAVHLLAAEGTAIGARTITGLTAPTISEATGPFNDHAEFIFRPRLDDNSSPVVIARLGTPPCNPADIATPPGTLDLADVDAFIIAFASGDPNASPSADIADTFGILDLADIDAFITAFSAGCP